jgi:phytoene/squalene synthetase
VRKSHDEGEDHVDAMKPALGGRLQHVVTHPLGETLARATVPTRFGVTVGQLREHRVTPELVDLMAYLRKRSRAMMLDGAPLAKRLPGRLGLEIAVVVHGGLRVLDKLDAVPHDPFARPRLDAADWARLLVGAALKAATR